MKRLTLIAVVAASMGWTVAAAPSTAEAGWARGYERQVWYWNGKIEHTSAYFSGWSKNGGCSSWRGSCFGTLRRQTNDIPNHWAQVTCMKESGTATWYSYGPMVYGLNGVCHQATNRALHRTPISWVYYWGSIGGAGLSNFYWGNRGKAWLNMAIPFWVPNLSWPC